MDHLSKEGLPAHRLYPINRDLSRVSRAAGNAWRASPPSPTRGRSHHRRRSRGRSGRAARGGNSRRPGRRNVDQQHIARAAVVFVADWDHASIIRCEASDVSEGLCRCEHLRAEFPGHSRWPHRSSRRVPARVRPRCRPGQVTTYRQRIDEETRIAARLIRAAGDRPGTR